MLASGSRAAHSLPPRPVTVTAARAFNVAPRRGCLLLPILAVPPPGGGAARAGGHGGRADSGADRERTCASRAAARSKRSNAPWAERIQYILKSPSGCPVMKVELWIGRSVRASSSSFAWARSRDPFPVKATLQFKKLSPVLKISTDSTFEFPLECGVFIPKDDAEQKMWGKTTKDMFYGGSGGDKQVVQGGLDYVSKKSGGSIRSFDIPASWEKTQIMCWCVQSAANQPRRSRHHPPHPPLHSHLPTPSPLLPSQVGRCRQEVVQVEHRDPPGAE